MLKTSSSSPGDRAGSKPVGKKPGLEWYAVLGMIFVGGSIVFPPFALGAVFFGLILRAPRNLGEFWGNLKLYWRRNLGSGWTRGLITAALVCLVVAVPLFALGTLPRSLEFTARELAWLSSSVSFALAGLFLGVFLHILARKPRKIGVEL